MTKMNEIRGPGEMDFANSQNLSETWRRWKLGMEYYLTATCNSRTDEAQKVAILMCMIGKDGQEIKDTFEFKTGEGGREVITTEIPFAKFEAYCKPKKNLVVERHRFLTRDQAACESVDQYVTELRTLAASCEWGELKDDLICSRVVSGISSRVVRERLLSESELKLDKAIETCRADELSRQQIQLFANEGNHVNDVRRTRAYRQKEKNKCVKQQKTKKAAEGKQEPKRGACRNCGSIHPKGQCSAHGKQCNKCKKMNHYARMCQSSKTVDTFRQQKQEKASEYLFLESVKVKSVDEIRESETEHVTLLLNSQEIQLKLDTGAEVNVIPYSTFRQVAKTSKIELRKPKVRLSAYNGKDIPVKAVCTLQCQHKGTSYDLEFFITNMDSEPVLSVSACKELGLIKFITAVDHKQTETNSTVSEYNGTEAFTTRIKTEYQDVFSGFGCLQWPYHIELDPKVQPVVILPRRVPFGLED